MLVAGRAERTGEEVRPGMVRVPSGPFLFGPRRERRATGAFWIDRAPVTNGAFAAFCREAGVRPPEHFRQASFVDRKHDHPVVGVSFAQALAYARSVGKDLPTEEEWEKAARGSDGRAYPWGENYEAGRCNASDGGRRDTTPVGAFPRGTSPCGGSDFAGNVWEWTRTLAGRTLAVVKGGSWYDPPVAARADRRFTARLAFASSSLGFRCVSREEPLEPVPLEVRLPRARAPLPEGSGEEWRDLLADLRVKARKELASPTARLDGIEFTVGELDALLETALAPTEEPAPPAPPPPPLAPEPAPARVSLPRPTRRELAVVLGCAAATFLGLRALLG